MYDTLAQYEAGKDGHYLDGLGPSGLLSQTATGQNDDVFLNSMISRCSSPVSGSSSDSEQRDPSYKNPRPALPIHEPKTEETKQVEEAFHEFGKTAGEQRTRPGKEWGQMTHRSQMRKAQVAGSLIQLMFKIMSPSDPKALEKLTLKQFSDWFKRSAINTNELMEVITEEYYKCLNNRDRIAILSLVARILPLGLIREYIPGLTPYMFHKARLFAIRNRHANLEDRDTSRQKYCKPIVQDFVSFLVSPAITIGLPFGTRTVKPTRGEKFDIPNTLRMFQSSEIYYLYGKYLDQKGVPNDNKHRISKSSVFKILAKCKATIRKARVCVDYFLEQGADAFDELAQFIAIWQENGDISLEWKKALIMALEEARQYLNTDYKLHVKMDSPVADHCIRFGLSDPSDINYQSQCNSTNSPYPHTHDAICDRCQAVKKVLGDVKDTAEQLKSEILDKLKGNPNDQKLKEKVNLYSRHTEKIVIGLSKIFEMKKHILRAAYSNAVYIKIYFTFQQLVYFKVRADSIDELMDGDGLLTFDFAMKQEKARHRETQQQWYGKSGNEWHIVHVVANISGVLVEHNFVHILTGDLQDSATVVAILRHVLSELKKMGILRVIIRSDNAKNYKCTTTISSIIDTQAEIGVQVLQYQFSETQAGKSSADRVAAIVKKKLGRFIAAGGDATTPKAFFDSIIVGQLIRATSIYLVSVEGEMPASNSKLNGLSTLFDFTFTVNGFVSRRYHNFGKGHTHDANEFTKLSHRLKILESGGILSDVYHIIDEKMALKNGKESIYWRALRCPSTDQACISEEIEAELSHEDVHLEKAGEKKEFLYPFSCPVEGCIAVFASLDGVDRHVEIGKHKFRPERMTMSDYAAHNFGDQASGINEDRAANKLIYIAVSNDFFNRDVDADPHQVNDLHENWAQRKIKRSGKNFSPEVVEFVTRYYDEGIETGNKYTGEQVENFMYDAVNEDGSQKFLPEERLNSDQITSLFTRITAKRKKMAAESGTAASAKPASKKASGSRRKPAGASSRPKRNSDDGDEEWAFYEELAEEMNEDQGEVELIGIKAEEAGTLEELIWEVIESNTAELFNLDEACELPEDILQDISGEARLENGNRIPDVPSRNKDGSIYHDELFVKI
ncbi:hypothetical protein WR25_27290 isoform L [Diploscapter pachys]|nr:hypothetical protein WR25_27290 isoform G [Diploscapter pachys]PAV66059.1 hypothetical protein WR25_27290 isoform L [Diploscapter pachys]